MIPCGPPIRCDCPGSRCDCAGARRCGAGASRSRRAAVPGSAASRPEARRTDPGVSAARELDSRRSTSYARERTPTASDERGAASESRRARSLADGFAERGREKFAAAGSAGETEGESGRIHIATYLPNSAPSGRTSSSSSGFLLACVEEDARAEVDEIAPEGMEGRIEDEITQDPFAVGMPIRISLKNPASPLQTHPIAGQGARPIFVSAKVSSRRPRATPPMRHRSSARGKARAVRSPVFMRNGNLRARNDATEATSLGSHHFPAGWRYDVAARFSRFAGQ